MKKHLIYGLLALFALTLTVTETKAQAAPGQEQLHSKVIDVTSAQLLASNATPVVLVTVPNSDYIIVPVSIVAHYDYKGTAYATNTTLNAGFGDGTVLLTGSIDLSVTADRITTFNTAFAGTVATTKNKSLVLKTATGNPATGTGTLKVYVTYRLLNLTAGTY